MYQFTMKDKNYPISFDIRHADYRIRHTHVDYWDFMFVTSGPLLHKINGQEVTLTKNMLCVVRPQDVHSIHNKKGTSSGHMNIMVASTFLKKFIGGIDPTLYDKLLKSPPISIMLPHTSAEKIRKYSGIILTSPKNDYQQSIKLLLLMFIEELLLNQLEHRDIKPGINRSVSELLKLLNDPANFVLSTRDLLAKTHYSYSHMNKIFQEELGMTFFSYLTQKKVEYAKALLTETSMPLSEIAFSLGYTSYAHFSVFFKKETNYSPGQYAKIYRNLTYSIDKDASQKEDVPEAKK